MDRQPDLDSMTAEEMIKVIMTQHWDLKACECWICEEGRKAGIRPAWSDLPHRGGIAKAKVRVDGTWLEKQ